MARSLGIDRRKVLALRAKGLTIQEVAERLGCSSSAVQYHMYRKTRERVKKSVAKEHKTERYRKWFREYYMKRYRSDPEFRSKHLERTKRYRRERYQADPEYRAKRLEYLRRYNRRRRIEQKK